ncbi:hypothetical protein BXA13_06915 [Campylobacter lari]|uniref:Lipoprotein n=2 Tax=Campylobacter TaxID=194 RepID=A0A7U8BK91_CAMLA|nr:MULTISPECIES: hypothetical protein [Campylobacter]EAJ5682034.1 hypothetical protein [Campylobacter lari]EGK8097714.1 hypothetical protein [Campylobacter lari]MCR6513015.1 hypothetical protein [Campylobacter lari]MCR6528531.1 hypothetical protein [Campylobacter lari]MCV3406744.1 hypothetical protein [Campylobacter lari]
MKHKVILFAFCAIFFSACSIKNNTNYNYLFDDKSGWVAVNDIKDQEKFLKMEIVPVFEKKEEKETSIKSFENIKKKKRIILNYPSMSYVILKKAVNDSNSYHEDKMVEAGEFDYSITYNTEQGDVFVKVLKQNLFFKEKDVQIIETEVLENKF